MDLQLRDSISIGMRLFGKTQEKNFAGLSQSGQYHINVEIVLSREPPTSYSNIDPLTILKMIQSFFNLVKYFPKNNNFTLIR